MNSSRANSQPSRPPASTETSRLKNYEVRPQSHLPEYAEVIAGSVSDAALVRALAVEAIRRSGKSRAQIADDMTYLTGVEVTERQLNGYTAESREDWRFPLELERAFCHATGDYSLMVARIELAGFTVIAGEDIAALDLGRKYLARKRAIAAFEEADRRADLDGGAL